MIDDLLSYELVHFLPFTAEVYERLFTLQNEAVWPFQVAALALGVLAIVFARRGSGVVVGIALTAAWAIVGWTFFIGPYADLLWVAPWFGAAFIVQAVALFAVGIRGRLEPDRSVAAPIAVLVLWPLLAPLSGRAWSGVEFFAITPDPTVVFTLALLPVRRHGVLWVLPLCWVVITTATAIATGLYIGLATPVVVIAIAWFLSRRGRTLVA